MQIAIGEYISFVDSDDFINRRMFEKLYNNALKYRANMAICACRYYFDNTDKHANSMDAYYNISHIKSGSILTPNIACPTVACSKLYKKSDIVASKILFPSRLYHEDEMFHFCYLAKVRPIVAVIDEPLYSYRMRDNSEQITSNTNSRLDMPAIYRGIFEYLKKENLLEIYIDDLLVLLENTFYHTWDNLDLNLQNQAYSEIRNLLLSINVKPAWLIEKRSLHTLFFDNDLKYVSTRLRKFDSIKISIVIPVYGTEKYLRRCLDSVINQTYKNIEVIIVNDFSPGNCREIVESYQKINSKIIYIEHEKNLSTLVARKTAIEKCSGDYTIFLDSDDSLELNACQILVDNLMKQKSDILHFGVNVVSCNEATSNEFVPYILAMHVSLEGVHIFNSLINYECPHPLWGKCFYTQVLKIADNYIDKFYSIHADDMYACYIIFYFANEYFSIENKLYNYYIESGGITQKMKSNISLEKWEIICRSTSYSLKYLYKFFVDVGIENMYALEFASLALQQFKYLESSLENIKTKYSMGDYYKVYSQYFDIDSYYMHKIKVKHAQACQETKIEVIKKIFKEEKNFCYQLLPYFFSIIGDGEYLTIRIFGIKVTLKNKKRGGRLFIITSSQILRAIFSIKIEDKKYMVLRLLGFKISIKHNFTQTKNDYNKS